MFSGIIWSSHDIIFLTIYLIICCLFFLLLTADNFIYQRATLIMLTANYVYQGWANLDCLKISSLFIILSITISFNILILCKSYISKVFSLILIAITFILCNIVCCRRQVIMLFYRRLLYLVLQWKVFWLVVLVGVLYLSRNQIG